MLTHVYVLLLVLDNRKHYWIGDPELEKLMPTARAGSRITRTEIRSSSGTSGTGRA